MYETEALPGVAPQHAILSARDLETFYDERDGALKYIIAYLESGEDWVLDHRGAPLEGLLVSGLGERMLGPAPVDDDVNESASVLNYVRAGRMLRILDWMDSNPENHIAGILQHPNLNAAFRERLKKILAILARGKLLETMFNEQSCEEMAAALRLMDQKKKDAII